MQLDETSTRLRKRIVFEAGRLHSRATKTPGTRRMAFLEKSTCFLVGKGKANAHKHVSVMEYKVCLQATDIQFMYNRYTAKVILCLGTIFANDYHFPTLDILRRVLRTNWRVRRERWKHSSCLLKRPDRRLKRGRLV